VVFGWPATQMGDSSCPILLCLARARARAAWAMRNHTRGHRIHVLRWPGYCNSRRPWLRHCSCCNSRWVETEIRTPRTLSVCFTGLSLGPRRVIGEKKCARQVTSPEQHCRDLYDSAKHACYNRTLQCVIVRCTVSATRLCCCCVLLCSH